MYAGFANLGLLKSVLGFVKTSSADAQYSAALCDWDCLLWHLSYDRKNHFTSRASMPEAFFKISTSMRSCAFLALAGETVVALA
jgi:hypothetical protein